ncbi:MAG: 7-cyano-7-deazaguanine synthase QueC [Rickettsiales bacterium]|nr:7-cyano-7-deazaguanine synthase QueC [Rickettsiales bacterium]
MSRKKAVVLLSGGIDSTTVLEIAKRKNFNICALSFDYNQRHSIELDKAKKIAQKNQSVSEHKIIKLDLRAIGGSALTTNIDVPKDNYYESLNTNNIPITYVPARNTIFLSIALGIAEVIGALDIFIGANVVDYSNYPDCRPEYLEAFEKMANLATASGAQGNNIKIHAPLLMLSKDSIIKKGIELGVDYSETISCYDPNPLGASCGKCDSCIIRKNAFTNLKIKDPIIYE